MSGPLHAAVRVLVLVGATAVLVACSKEKEVEPPAELVEFEPAVPMERTWQSSVGGSEIALRLGLDVAVAGGRAFGAGQNGEVAALDAASGRLAWRVRTKAALSGGPGADEELVVVGSSDGDVIALGAADGQVRWRVPVSGEVLSAPAVGPTGVFVRTVDGRLLALDRGDGRTLWAVDQQIPRLTLRGTASPVVVGDVVLCGFDNGKVIAVGARDGTVLWETAVAPSRGRTELERLADIDSAVRVVDEDVYAVGFQGRAAMLALETGQVWWSRDVSSHRGLDVDADTAYVATADGAVAAYRRRTGAELWTQPALARRGLSAPRVWGDLVVVGDFEGYVHFLDRATGAFVARESAGGDRISRAPVVVDDLLLVMSDAGRVTAFRRKG
jgi:outer membrane protein assembly factor BamB